MFALLLAEELIRGDKPLPLVLELLELALPLGRTIAALLEVVRVRTQEEEKRAPRRDVQVHGAEYPHRLGKGVQRQFGAWGLTTAEREIGQLLLQGLSHKEIARLRDTGEATVRRQATSLYRKADLGGRAALSAFFLGACSMSPRMTLPRDGRSSREGKRRRWVEGAVRRTCQHRFPHLPGTSPTLDT